MGKHLLSIVKVNELLHGLPDFKDFKATPMQEGVSTAVYNLKRDSEEYFLRFSEEGKNISSEVYAHQLILEKGVSIPKVIYYQDFNEIVDRSFSITTKIEGEKIRSKEVEALIQAGKEIALVNTIQEIDGFGDIRRTPESVLKLVGKYKTYDEYVHNMDRIEAMLEDLVKAGIFDKKYVKKYLKYSREKKELLEVENPVLSHGDFDRSHIYTKNSIYQGIIDWGDLRGTSVYHDLAHVYAYNPNYFDSIYLGYKEVNDLGADYLNNIKLVATYFMIGKLWYKYHYKKPGQYNYPSERIKRLNQMIKDVYPSFGEPS